MSQNQDVAKNVLDFASALAAIGAFLELLTPVFGLIGAVWTLMRILEMVTGKPFVDIIRRKKASDAEQK